MRYHEHRQLQPRRMGHLPARSEGGVAIATASAVSAAIAVAAAVTDAAAVSGTASSSAPSVHVPHWAASMQRQLPSADCCVGVPLWHL